MPYRILLVDDEPWTLKSLMLAVPWEAQGFSVCAALTSAREALVAIGELLPDVVFADIRMPIMDGLEFLTAVRAQWPFIQTVILSGYADFSYAKSAISLGVIGYCLKPIDEDEIMTSLHKAREAIRVQNARYVELLTRGQSEQAGSPWPALLSMHGVKEPPLDALVAGTGQTYLNVPAMRVEMEGETVFFYERRLRDRVLAALDDRQTIGMAEIAEADGAALRVGWIRARIARQGYFMDRPVGVSIYTEAPIQPIEEIARSFTRHFTSGNAALALDALQKLEALLLGGPYHADHALIAYNLICECLPLERSRSVHELIERYGSLSAMHDTIRTAMASEDVRHGEFLDMAGYVQTHLDSPDLFQDMSQTFHMSASHLSRLFRRYAGETFTQYVLNLRMKHARSLLEKTDLTVREVGVRCGYPDYFYFARQFRRTLGISPSEYRRRERGA